MSSCDEYALNLCQDCGRELDANREDPENNTYCSVCDPDASDEDRTCDWCASPLEAEQISNDSVYCSVCSRWDETFETVVSQAKQCKHRSANHYQTEAGIDFTLSKGVSELKLVFTLGSSLKTYSWRKTEKPKLAVLDGQLYESEQELDNWIVSLCSMFTNSFGNSAKPVKARSRPSKTTPYCK